MQSVTQNSDRPHGIVREPVESSVIQSMGYDGDLAVLEVEFVSGQLWRYHFIPHRIWTQLRRASSKGAYFANAIREKFPATRIT